MWQGPVVNLANFDPSLRPLPQVLTLLTSTHPLPLPKTLVKTFQPDILVEETPILVLRFFSLSFTSALSRSIAYLSFPICELDGLLKQRGQRK